MPSVPTSEPSGSPVPGVIPGRVRISGDAVSQHEGVPAPPPGSGGPTRPAPSHAHRNVGGTALGKLLAIIRGDKYMVGAYPASGLGAGSHGAREPAPDATAAVSDGQATVAPELNTAAHAPLHR